MLQFAWIHYYNFQYLQSFQVGGKYLEEFSYTYFWLIYKTEGECMWYNQRNPGDLGGGQMFNVELGPREQYVRLIIND